MVSLHDLPDELLAMIAGHLATPTAGPDSVRRDAGKAAMDHVAAMRATDRRCARIADPLLRCTIDERCALRPMRPSELARWACKVARHPERARFVQAIHLSRWPPPGDCSSKDFEAPPADEYAALVHRAGLPAAWAAELLRGLALKSDAAHLALLLIACPNLRSFRANATLADLGPLLEAVIAHCRGHRPLPASAPTPCIWSNVRHLEIGSEWSVTTVRDVLPLLSLPRLTTLSVRRLCDATIGRDLNLRTRLPCSRRPLELLFEDCFLSGTGLAQILEACNVRSLHVEWLSPCSPDFKERPGAGRCASQLLPFDDADVIAEVGHVIRELATRLEYLYLDLVGALHPDHSSLALLGPFANLARLHTLCLPPGAFDCSDLGLPPMLETLCVLDASPFETVDQTTLDHLSRIGASCPSRIQLATLPTRHLRDQFKHGYGKLPLHCATKEFVAM